MKKNQQKKHTENGSIVWCNQSLWKPWDAKLIWDFIYILFKAEIFTVAAKLKALVHIEPDGVNNPQGRQESKTWLPICIGGE